MFNMNGHDAYMNWEKTEKDGPEMDFQDVVNAEYGIRFKGNEHKHKITHFDPNDRTMIVSFDFEIFFNL